MKANEDKTEDTISTEDLLKFNKFYKNPCPVVRDDVFHGWTIEKNRKEVVCLYCRHKYNLDYLDKINSREITEKSLKECYDQNNEKVDLSPSPKKRPKKRWYHKYLFWRG